MINYEKAYDVIMEIQEELKPEVIGSGLDYKLVQTLAATFTLQDYLANIIAEIGETEEGEEYAE